MNTWARSDGNPRPGVSAKKESDGNHDEGSSQEEEEYDELQTYFCKLYPNLFTRKGKIRNAKVRADFFENLKPIQQKGLRVPISLQDKVDKEIDRLIKEGHTIKLQECSDKYFVSPIVITVKKNGSIKLALESRELNKQVHKIKYQMPNIDELVDGISQIIAERKAGMYILQHWISLTHTDKYPWNKRLASNAIFH